MLLLRLFNLVIPAKIVFIYWISLSPRMLREVRGLATSVQLPARFRWFHQQPDRLLFPPFSSWRPLSLFIKSNHASPHSLHKLMHCFSALIQLILHEVPLFAQSAKCAFEYNTAPYPREFVPCFLICSPSLSLSLLIPPQYNYLMVQCFSEPLYTYHLSLHLQQLCIKVHAA